MNYLRFFRKRSKKEIEKQPNRVGRAAFIKNVKRSGRPTRFFDKSEAKNFYLEDL